MGTFVMSTSSFSKESAQTQIPELLSRVNMRAFVEKSFLSLYYLHPFSILVPN